MNWKGEKVLVTGANGFVGSWVAKALAEKGAELIVPIKDINEHGNLKILNINSKVIECDLSEENCVNKMFEKNEVDAVFHLAAQAIVGIANKEPVPTFKSNIQGTWNLMEVCRKKDIQRIVVASSDKAYGDHKELPYKETSALLPRYPYDTSKACADLIARSYFFTYDMPIAVTRCANIYGPADMNKSRIVPDIITSLLKGKTPIIRSDGTPERDYLYVQDAADAYLLIAENLDRKEVKGEIFNIGNEKPIKVIDLYKEIAKACEKPEVKPKIMSKGKLKGEIDRQYLGTQKIKGTLSWKAKVPLENGLKKSVEWYRKNLDLF